jgi:hypothetical protein
MNLPSFIRSEKFLELSNDRYLLKKSTSWRPQRLLDSATKLLGMDECDPCYSEAPLEHWTLGTVRLKRFGSHTLAQQIALSGQYSGFYLGGTSAW